MMQSETFLLDTLTVAARDIGDADIKSLLALSVSVGWQHRVEDWDLILMFGRGLAATDEVGRVHGTAMWFPFGDRHATIGMVITTPRLQTHGGAQWLMRHLLHQVQGRELGLHATKQSHRLFLSLGFRDEGTVYQHQGRVAVLPELSSSPDFEIRQFDPSDSAAIGELDRATTGWDRHAFLEALVDRSRGVVLSRHGKVEACALMRPFGRGVVVGPIIAGSQDDAISVLRPLLIDQMGRYVRVDTCEDDSRFARFVQQCGITVGETVTRMSRDEPWPFTRCDGPFLFALASQATG